MALVVLGYCSAHAAKILPPEVIAREASNELAEGSESVVAVDHSASRWV